MDKLKQWLRAHRPTKRRLIQVYAALLYNAHLTGFAEGKIYTGVLKNLCVPGLNCYSCPGAAFACPLGALQNALAASGTRAPAYILGILLLFGLSLGRAVCGYLCPVGLVQELLHKLPTTKLRKSRVTRALSWVKYLILLIFVILIPLLYGLRDIPLPAFCKYICPAGTLEGAIGLLAHPGNADKLPMLGVLFTRKFVIAVLLVTAAVFIYRVFCRFLCPLGALYGLFAKLSIPGIEVDTGKCTACGACTACCPMDIRQPGDRECIQCGACLSACPTGAIHHRGFCHTAGDRPASRHPLLKRGTVLWLIALLWLGGILWFVNQPATDASPADLPAADIAATADEAPIGFEVGQICPDFTVPLYGGGDFVLHEHRGQITVVNFWATWCTPCINELPCFESLAAAHPDTLAVVAIHSSLVTEDVEAWLARHEYALPFALDPDGSVIASLGGSTMLPMTVIIGPDGRVIYNRVGSVIDESLAGILMDYLE